MQRERVKADRLRKPENPQAFNEAVYEQGFIDGLFRWQVELDTLIKYYQQEESNPE